MSIKTSRTRLEVLFEAVEKARLRDRTNTHPHAVGTQRRSPEAAKSHREERRFETEALGALVDGVAALVKTQKRIADEFGLSYERVFHDAYEAFKGEEPRRVLAKWLNGGPEGRARLQALFADLLAHQLAVIEGLDGVAQEALAPGPEPAKGLSKVLNCMRRRRRRNPSRRELASDRTLRFRQLIGPGFATGYSRANGAERRGEESSEELERRE